MSVTTLLRTAAAEHDAVTLTYCEGVNQDAVGTVIPVAVHGEYLEAIVDPATNFRKLFKLTRIAAVKCAGGRYAVNPAAHVGDAGRQLFACPVPART